MVKGITKAQRELTFVTAAGEGTGPSVNYVDSGQSLSIVNRKLFSQKKVYGIERVEIVYGQQFDIVTGAPVNDGLIVTVQTALDTWPVHNGWVKGHALHTEMQDLVLEDNPSIKGKWAEYKVFLDGDHRNAVIGAAPPGNLTPYDGNGNLYVDGEWQYSTFVMPQHDVDPVTGEPLAADETTVHLLGPNLINPGDGSYQSAGLVEAYALSRATVQPEDPAVPPGMADSFFNLLTDSGSQEPELALVIEGENDEPPYDQQNYPGGATNGPAPSTVDIVHLNAINPNGAMNGFLAPCGLFKISLQATLAGQAVATPTALIRVTWAPGMYKGVAAIDMGQ